MSKTSLGRVSLVPKGAYNAVTAYERLDVVTYEGASYIVLRDVQGVTPVDGEDYMLLAKGLPGPKGDMGDPFTYDKFTPEQLAALKGDPGATPELSIGTVTTLEPGSEAKASFTGTKEKPVLNLSLPRGASGGVDVANAEVGQTIIVKAVDENGKPTEWEAADMASGGGGSEWTKLGDITVNEAYEFIPLSFTGGVVTIDINAEGYEYLTSKSYVPCVVVPINIVTKEQTVNGRLYVTDANAGTFDFYDGDGVAQTSAAYDPATYKIVVQNVGSVVMENVPTTYDRYKLRVTTPAINTRGLRPFFYSTISALGLPATASTNRTGGSFVEIELLTIPENPDYMYRSLFFAYGPVYNGSSSNELRAFDIVQAGTGLTKPPVNGTVTFTAINMVFVNGTRFELWGANDD